VRTNGVVRASENSLAFAQKAAELSLRSFVAVDSGIGLGGVLPAKRRSPLEAVVLEAQHEGRVAKADATRADSAADMNAVTVKTNLASPATPAAGIRRVAAWFVDLLLASAGLVICLLVVASSHPELTQAMHGWRNNLNPTMLLSVLSAGIFTVYLAYWLCFRIFVGRTPGQFLMLKQISSTFDEPRVGANPLIHKG
jgi:hypothetical protein